MVFKRPQSAMVDETGIQQSCTRTNGLAERLSITAERTCLLLDILSVAIDVVKSIIVFCATNEHAIVVVARMEG